MQSLKYIIGNSDQFYSQYYNTTRVSSPTQIDTNQHELVA